VERVSITEAALLREVAQVQRNKTLLDVRDLIDGIRTEKAATRGYGMDPRTAKEFRDDLVRALQQLKEAE